MLAHTSAWPAEEFRSVATPVSTTLIRACATSRNDRAHVSCFREDKALNHSLEAM
jgi:hypothetical protein